MYIPHNCSAFSSTYTRDQPHQRASPCRAQCKTLTVPTGPSSIVDPSNTVDSIVHGLIVCARDNQAITSKVLHSREADRSLSAGRR